MFRLFDSQAEFKRSLAKHRMLVSSVKSKIQYADNVVFLEDFLKNDNEDTLIPLWVFRPENIEPPYTTLLYIPGTAFIAQEVEVTQAICSHIAKMAKCQVVVINHRLAPENQFPKGYRDAEAIVRYLINNPKSLKIDSSKIILSGYSSGGNFAAQITLSNELPICCQILVSPLVDLSRSIQEYKKYEAMDEVITEDFVNWFLRFYIPDTMNAQDPEISPYFKSIEESKKMAATFLIAGEYDRFRGDTEAFAKKLEGKANKICKEILKGENHSFLWHKLEAIESIARIIKENTSLFLEYPLIYNTYQNRIPLYEPALLEQGQDESELPEYEEAIDSNAFTRHKL